MTRFLNRPVCGVVALLLCVSLVSPAFGQITEGKTAFDHLKTSGVHAPGTLVQDGVSRAGAKVQLPFGGTDTVGINITETEHPRNNSEILTDSLMDALFIALGVELSRFLTALVADLFSGELFAANGTTTPDASTPTPPVTTTPPDTTGDGRGDTGRKVRDSR